MNEVKGYKVWVDTGESQLHTNAVVVKTMEEAKAVGADLFNRWMLVQRFECRSTSDEPNYAWKDGKLVSLASSEAADVLPS